MASNSCGFRVGEGHQLGTIVTPCHVMLQRIGKNGASRTVSSRRSYRRKTLRGARLAQDVPICSSCTAEVLVASTQQVSVATPVAPAFMVDWMWTTPCTGRQFFFARHFSLVTREWNEVECLDLQELMILPRWLLMLSCMVKSMAISGNNRSKRCLQCTLMKIGHLAIPPKPALSMIEDFFQCTTLLAAPALVSVAAL